MPEDLKIHASNRSETRPVWLKLSRNARKRQVSRVFAPTALAAQIWRAIDAVREEGLMGREPTCVLITGDTGVGKTEILKRYMAMNPPYRVARQMVRPVLFVSLPARASPRDAALAMLRVLWHPRDATGELKSREEEHLQRVIPRTKNDAIAMAKRKMKNQKVEAICFDEFQHASDRGNSKSQSDTMDFIKDLVKTAEIPIVMAGMPSVTSAVNDHAQLSGLTQHRFKISNFPYGTKDHRQSYQCFLQVIAEQLPFDCVPRLDHPDVALALHVMTGGNLRRLVRILSVASDAAIDRDADELTILEVGLGAAQIFHMLPARERPTEFPFEVLIRQFPNVLR